MSFRPSASALALLLAAPAGLPAREPAPAPPPAERAANLAAFGRLLSAVRFFHPSDEGLRCDWNGFAVAGVEAVEGAAGPSDLAARLRRLFAPVAPTLRLSPAGEPSPRVPPALLPPDGDESKLRRVRFRHYGAKLDQPSVPGAKPSVLGSERIDSVADLGWGSVAQSVPAGALRGRRVRLTAWVDAEVSGPRARAQLWLRTDRPNGERGFFDNMADRPIRVGGWREVEIAGAIEADAETIVVGLAFTGAGRVRMDDVKLESEDGAPLVAARLENADFQRGEPKAQPPGWTFPYESVRAGYRLGLIAGAPCRKGSCAEIESGPIAAPPFPAPAETFRLDLPGGVAAELPVVLYADGRGTLPHAREGEAGGSCLPGGEPPPPAPTTGAGPEIARGLRPEGPSTRSERLAALLLAHGAIDLFRAYGVGDGAPPGWPESLPGALAEAMAAPDDATFLAVFRRHLAGLADGNASVFRPGLAPAGRLPIDWRFLDGGHLYVAATAPGVTEVQAGDLVVAVDGTPVGKHALLQGSEVSAATSEARRSQAAKLFLYGEAGSEVALEILGAGGAARRAVLRRSLPVETEVEPPGPDPLAAPAPGLLYVDLGRMDDAAFRAALPRLAGARGLVFDLRDGADVSNALIAHLLAPSRPPARGPGLFLPVRILPEGPPLDWLETFWTIAPAAPHLAAPCAFLLGAESKGYAETLLSMVEHERLCALVGRRSAGTNGSVNAMQLPGGYRVAFTALKVRKPDGSRHYGAGIEPTLAVTATPAGLAAGRDEVLEAALALLKR